MTHTSVLAVTNSDSHRVPLRVERQMMIRMGGSDTNDLTNLSLKSGPLSVHKQQLSTQEHSFMIDLRDLGYTVECSCSKMPQHTTNQIIIGKTSPLVMLCFVVHGSFHNWNTQRTTLSIWSGHSIVVNIQYLHFLWSHVLLIHFMILHQLPHYLHIHKKGNTTLKFEFYVEDDGRKNGSWEYLYYY